MIKRYGFYSLFLLMILLAETVQSQVVSGTIVSGDGSPLAGASVLVKGTTIGTSADANGFYSFELVPGTHELVFSFVGYSPYIISISVVADEKRTLDVHLHQTTIPTYDVVVVGSRTYSRTITDSPLPIDVLSYQELSSTGQTTFDKTLQYRVPSFSVSQTPVNDATALLDPWEIRNMGVSRTLILINGKRKNLSSLVYTQTSPSRGESAVDISTIPLDAIERVEILRDGASAQYGSDAIAGVVNIVLKDNPEGGYVTLNSGVTGEGDGERVGLSLNNGSSIFGNSGFINYTVDLSRIREARRSGIVDAQGEVSDFGANLTDVQNFLAFDPTAGNRNSAPATSSAKFLFNTGVNISENTSFYGNGAYLYKKVTSYANYRTPYWRTLADFPYLKDFFAGGDSAAYRGYLPTFDGDLIDYNLTIGFNSVVNEWNYDASLTFGFNSQDYTVLNSHNRSDFVDSNGVHIYQENSPINFKPGGTEFSHQVGNIDVSKRLNEQFSFAFGAEFRSETFEIIEGDKASWDGIGADSYSGNRPENSGTFNRYNIGGYINADFDITPQFLISGAIRNEYYSDFGNAFVYKISSRFKFLNDMVTVRGSYSTGFKAPTLHQIYTQRVQYSFVPGQGIQSIGLINNVSPQARVLGVKPLQPEESKNITVGLGAMVTENVNITFDYYDIAITDRIVISNRVPFGTGGEVEFFTNSIDTKTTGVDLVVDYRNLVLGGGILGFSVAGNINLKNEMEGNIPQVGGIDVIDSTQQHLFFTSRPKEKFVGGVTYDFGALHLSIFATYFGSTEFKQTGLDPNLKTVFDPKVVTDFGVSYDIFSDLVITANVNNVFDVLPEWNFEAVNSAGESILSDPEQVKVQTNLVTFNGRYDVMTYDGYHFSQLGRIFNLALTYKF